MAEQLRTAGMPGAAPGEEASPARRRAVFLDRDGTLVEPYPYPTQRAHLRLVEGIAPALRLLQEAGFVPVVVTNQSGMARGYLDRAALDGLHAYVASLLAAQGVVLAATYDCPHHPAGVVAALRLSCACRKPRPGLLLRAAADLGLDLAASWMVGDRLDDVEAGHRAGCRTVLVDAGRAATGDGSGEAASRAAGDDPRRPHHVARDTAGALDIVVCREGLAYGAGRVAVAPGSEGGYDGRGR